jgi:hypothetical protein
MGLIDSIGDPTLTIGMSFAAIPAKVETDELSDVTRWVQTVHRPRRRRRHQREPRSRVTLGRGVRARGSARWGLGHPEWRQDFDQAIAIARGTEPLSHAIVIGYKYTPQSQLQCFFYPTTPPGTTSMKRLRQSIAEYPWSQPGPADRPSSYERKCDKGSNR